MTKVCKYCGTTVNTKTLGIIGKYNRTWRYCSQHRKEAVYSRRKFLRLRLKEFREERGY